MKATMDNVGPDTPLRLSVAAALAFPDGSLKASGLRREASRGRLVIERIAGKYFTTMANINRMRELCRVEQKASDSGYDPRAAQQAARSIGYRPVREKLVESLVEVRKMPSASAQVIEKIGGPGRTRTCNQTVMSGRL